MTMKQFLIWCVYLITIICAGGWYILELKNTIADKDAIIVKKDILIQELTISQHPPITPDKVKIKYKDKIVEKKVTVVDKKCKAEYEKLKAQTLQCAYNLQFCQESSKIYNKMVPKQEVKK